MTEPAAPKTTTPSIMTLAEAQAIADSAGDDVRRLTLEKAAMAGLVARQRAEHEALHTGLVEQLTNAQAEIEALRAVVPAEAAAQVPEGVQVELEQRVADAHAETAAARAEAEALAQRVQALAAADEEKEAALQALREQLVSITWERDDLRRQVLQQPDALPPGEVDTQPSDGG